MRPNHICRISTTSLSYLLNEMHVSDKVVSAKVEDGKLKLKTLARNLICEVDMLNRHNSEAFNQTRAKWDEVKRLISGLPEYIIVLQLMENNVSIIFNF